MPITNSGNTGNVRGNNQYLPRNTQNQPESGTQNNISQEQQLSTVSSNYYRQFGITQNTNFSAERVSYDDDNTLQEIYTLDREAFSELDPYNNYNEFKHYLRSDNLSVYALKDSNNQILGYYQLEPIKNRDLYIDSIGLKPEYRNSRKGYNAIQYAWNKILDYAENNNVETLSLHVDATNPRLLRMYKSLGFEVAETYDNYYENGAGAYFMTRPVRMQNANPEPVAQTTNPVNISMNTPSEEVVTPVISTFKQEYKQAEEELKNYGLNTPAEAYKYLNLCIENDKNNKKTFNQDIYTCVKELRKLELQVDNQDNDYSKNLHVKDIIEILKQQDKIGDIKVRTDILPYIKQMVNSGNIRPCDITEILRSSKFNKDALNFACKLNKNQRAAIDVCMKDNEFNKQAADMYLELNDRGIDNSALILLGYKTVNGETVFDSSSVRAGARYLALDNYEYPMGRDYDTKGILETGCPLDVYLKFYDKIHDIKKDFGINLSTLFVYKDRTASLIKAAAYKGYEGEDFWDGKVVNDYNQLIENKTFFFNEGNNFDIEKNNYITTSEILNSCKTKENSYLPMRYNPSLLDKAIQLKEAGFTSDIPKLMELCKTRTDIGSGYETVKFDDAIFNAILELKSTRPYSDINTVSPIIEASKTTHNNNEEFDLGFFNTIKDNHSDTFKYFIKRDKNGNKEYFDSDLYNYYIHSGVHEVEALSNRDSKGNRMVNKNAIDAYKRLSEMNYEVAFNDEQNMSKQKADRLLISRCIDNYNDFSEKFNTDVFNKIIFLLNKGLTGSDTNKIIYSCREYKGNEEIYNPLSEKKYQKIVELLDRNIDIESAIAISSGYNEPEKLEKYDILYNKGVTGGALSTGINACYEKEDELSEPEFNQLAFDRLLVATDRDFTPSYISACKDDDKFSDRIFRLGLDMQDRGYTTKQIEEILNVCHEKQNDTNKLSGQKTSFNYDMFSKVQELEQLGIEKDSIKDVLSSCKTNYHNKFNNDAYKKVSDLHNKQFDDKGICKFISYCFKDGGFNEDAYNNLVQLTAQHVSLRDSTHGDDYVVQKLYENKQAIQNVKEVFGEDVLDYATSFKIDGYKTFVQNCDTLNRNISDSYKEDLQRRLKELTSPEQKVKRLRVLSGLVGKVSEDSMKPLLLLIKSPKMTDEQVKLANDIFTQENVPYEEQIETFISEINVPEQNKNTVRQYLQKARIDKVINRPKTIDEQMKQMDEYAQQMLTNPKIPLDKKIKYIDEFKAKKADMAANPDKYTTPYIFEKPMEGIKKVVEAYVNIPNNDLKFSNAVLESLYSNLGIETTPELLQNIHYDSKYFDKLFSMASDTKPNFIRLINLVKANPNEKLSDIRLMLPEEGSEKYQKYSNYGLIEQINANLDTNHQLRSHGIDVDRWNNFDSNLKGESFSIVADAATDYQNTKFNIINSFNDELFQKISKEETDKLKEHLSQFGYVMFNNNIFSRGNEIKDNELGNFLDCVINYVNKNNYWKSAKGEGSMRLSDSEAEGATGFMDHINGFRKRIDDIKNARNVNDIHFSLSDDNDIGRNIFLGNHVGCCNSIESSYAGYSAPMHLLNNYNRGIEIVDKYGNSYGNSLCFFADVDDKLTFVIDSFEANGKLGSDPVVTKHLLDFAKQVCKYMGREDAQIMVGPNFNHISIEGLKATNGHTIKVLGKTSEKTYCDSIGGKVSTDKFNNIATERSMYELA